MEHVGYSLLHTEKFTEDAFWGDTKGECPTLPDPLILPNGDAVHCARLNDTYAAWKLVQRWLVDERPSRWHRVISSKIEWLDDRLVVTRLYEEHPSLVPVAVSAVQLRLALGAKVVKFSGDDKTIWEYSHEFRHDSPFIQRLREQLKWAHGDIDSLFRSAADIHV